MNTTFMLLEAKRLLRNGRFLIFTIGFPVVFFLIFSSIYGNQPGQDGDSARAWLMVSMAAFGGTVAALSTGMRIAVERGSGWQRQLRLTSLSGGAYLLTKAAVGMLVAAVPMLLVYLLGGVLKDVHLSAAQWVTAGIGSWIAILPFAAIGVLLGQVTSPDSVQPVGMIASLGMSMLGGLWFPPEIMPSWMASVAKFVPTYWLRQFGVDVVDSNFVNMTAIGVLAVWLVLIAGLAARRFRTDTARA